MLMSKQYIFRWPAPCYSVGEPELVYAYVGIGLAIPAVMTVFVQRHVFFRSLRKAWQFRCRRSGLAGEQDNQHNPDSNKIGLTKEATVSEKVRQLAAKRAKRSRVYDLALEASNSQALLGQVVVSH